MNKILPLLFLIPVFLLAIWVQVLQTRRESGQNVVVAINGYDPRDLLAGHYILYTIDWDKTDCTQFEKNICPRQAFLTKNRRGHTNNQLRFYVPEDKAAQLDYLLSNQTENKMKFEIVFSYQKGYTPMAKQLLINGKDWREVNLPVQNFQELLDF